MPCLLSRRRLDDLVLFPSHAWRPAAVERLRGALLAEEVLGPALERIDAVAAPGHEGGVDPQPGREGDLAVELDAGRDLGDRGASADHRHRPLVAIVERLGGPPIDLGDDRVGRGMAALQGHRAELRVRLVLAVRDVGDVADHEDPRKARDGQVRLDVDPATLALWKAGRGGDRCRFQAATPHDAAGQDRRSVRERHVARPDLRDAHAEP